jgi:hypothetical protein
MRKTPPHRLPGFNLSWTLGGAAVTMPKESLKRCEDCGIVKNVRYLPIYGPEPGKRLCDACAEKTVVPAVQPSVDLPKGTWRDRPPLL